MKQLFFTCIVAFTLCASASAKEPAFNAHHNKALTIEQQDTTMYRSKQHKGQNDTTSQKSKKKVRKAGKSKDSKPRKDSASRIMDVTVARPDMQ